MESFVASLSSLLVQLPVFLVWFAGILVGIIRWPKHPKVSRLITVAVALFFLGSVVSTFINAWVPYNLDHQQIAQVFMIKGLIHSLLDAVLWGIVFVAVFAWRGE